MLEVLRDNLVELLGFLGGGELAVVGCVLGKTLVTWGGLVCEGCELCQ